MKKLLLSFSLLLMSFGAFASDYKLGDLGIDAPWAQISDDTGRTGSAFVTIINNSDIGDVLEGVSTPRAGRIALINAQGQQTSFINIVGSQMVDMTPSGAHMLLSNFSAPLQIGEQFPITLHFKNSGSITVQTEVRENNEHPMNTTIMRNNVRHNGKLK